MEKCAADKECNRQQGGRARDEIGTRSGRNRDALRTRSERIRVAPDHQLLQALVAANASA